MKRVITHQNKTEIHGEVLYEFTMGLSADEVLYKVYEVADSTTDESIDLGGITTASVVMISADQDISVKVNSGSVGISINADGQLTLFDTSVTALSVTNASGSTAIVTVILAGT